MALIWPKSRYWMLALATVIASARVGANKHFLSDILGGAALAAVTTFWLRERFARVGICFKHDAKGLKDRIGMVVSRAPSQRDSPDPRKPG